MIAPYRQFDVDIEKIYRIPVLPLVSLMVGLALGFLFSSLWPGFEGLASWALWPLGLAAGLFSVTFVSTFVSHQLNWDLLIAGKILTLMGAVMFFVASF